MSEHEHWMALAEQQAEKSNLPGRKVGAVIVLNGHLFGVGKNEIPAFLDGTETAPYKITVCAELSAMMKSSAETGATLYVWPIPPCVQCTLSIIAARFISTVVVPAPNPEHPVLGGRWKTRWEWSKAQFRQSMIEVVEMDTQAKVAA